MDIYHHQSYSSEQEQIIKDKAKLQELKERIAPFASVKTIEDAKVLAEKIFPTNQDYTTFFVGNAKCTVVNKSDLYRISIDTAKEFICYSFCRSEGKNAQTRN